MSYGTNYDTDILETRYEANKLFSRTGLQGTKKNPQKNFSILLSGTKLLLPDSSPEDLQAVTCATHKEDRSDVMLAKTAGILCVCLPSGIIMLMQEVYGSESLPQRYFCLAAAKAAVPEAVLLVHDDSCHLYKYCLKRKEAGWP